jgi:hypothetical protein
VFIEDFEKENGLFSFLKIYRCIITVLEGVFTYTYAIYTTYINLIKILLKLRENVEENTL